MKKIFSIIAFLFIALTTFSQGGIQGDGRLAPTGPYQIIKFGEGQTGFWPMVRISQRDSIPSWQRTYGMIVYVKDTDSSYQLKSITLDNTSWFAFKQGSVDLSAYTTNARLLDSLTAVQARIQTKLTKADADTYYPAIQRMIDSLVAVQARIQTKEPFLGFTAVPNTRTINGYDLSANRTLNKTDIGLGNVPNLDFSNPVNITQSSTYRFVSDAEKTTWNAKQNALGYTAENVANKGVANGYADLDALGKVPASRLDFGQIGQTYVVASQTAMLAISGANVGALAIRTDNNRNYRLIASPASTLANWQILASPDAPVQSVNGQTGNVNLLTTNISEGTNLWFTISRARASLSAGTGISYDNTNGVITNTITQYTDALARAAQNTASTSVTGLLSSTDWNTFNNKQAALGFTPYNATNPSGFISGITTAMVNAVGSITNSTSGNAATATLAANSTLWNGASLSGGVSGSTPTSILGYDGTNFIQRSAGAVQSFLGLGSNAYTSTPYFPLTAGSGQALSGNLYIGNAAALTNRYLYIDGVASKAAAIGFKQGGIDKWLIGNGAASEDNNFELYNNSIGLNAIKVTAANNNVALTGALSGTSLSMSGGGSFNGTFDVGGISNFLRPVYIRGFTGGYTISAGGSGGDYGSIGYNLSYTATSGTYNYAVSDYASFIRYSTGGFQFFTAPSGLVGSLMSPTLRYTLDVNGNNTWTGNGSFGGAIKSTFAELSNPVYLRSQPTLVNEAQYQDWRNSAGIRRAYFGFDGASSNNMALDNETGGNIRLMISNLNKLFVSQNYTAIDGYLSVTNEIYPGRNNGVPLLGQTQYYLYGNSAEAGIRTNGNFLATGDIYLGARGQYLSTWLNQAVTTTARPVFLSLRADEGFTSASAQGRFGGWYNGVGFTGAAVEVGYSGGAGSIIAYNRDNASYSPMYVSGTNVHLQAQGGFVSTNTRFNINGAVDNSGFALNVAGAGIFSISATAPNFIGNWNGLTYNASAVNNTIVQRDAGGHITANYILGTYFNAASGNNENPNIGQIWTQNTTDNYLRKSTPASFISQLGLATTASLSNYVDISTNQLEIAGNKTFLNTLTASNLVATTQTLTAAGTVAANITTVFCSNLSGAAYTITLPAATGKNGQFLLIIKTAGGLNNNVAVSGASDALLSLFCKSSVLLVCDGTTWRIASFYNASAECA